MSDGTWTALAAILGLFVVKPWIDKLTSREWWDAYHARRDAKLKAKMLANLLDRGRE